MSKDTEIAVWIISAIAIVFFISYTSIVMYSSCYGIKRNIKYIKSIEQKFQEKEKEYLDIIEKLNEKLSIREDGMKEITFV